MLKPYYDVVVIGGGIHGVGVAQAAAARGYSVLLLEQNEIASGTSRKSSKLIHGGLRYLESGQFSLVRECLTERHLLLQNAPHLVEMKPFYFPVYEHTTRRPWQLQIGLSLYALLAGFRKQAFFHRLKNGNRNWAQLDGLTTRNLQAVFQYWDAQTDDQLLTRAVLGSAKDMGADAIEHAQLCLACHHDNGWQIGYKTEMGDFEVGSTVLVNAAGPWVNETLKRIAPDEKGMAVDLVQGTHIVLAEKIRQGIYYVESPEDRRAIFVMPWYGQTLVGTTEKMFAGDPAKVRPTAEEVRYLLATASHYFPRFAQAEVKHSFAGLRVLPRQEGAAFSRPRETTIYLDKTGSCFSIYGGKLTAYRATSAQVVNRFQGLLPVKRLIADTRYLKLPDVGTE